MLPTLGAHVGSVFFTTAAAHVGFILMEGRRMTHKVFPALVPRSHAFSRFVWTENLPLCHYEVRCLFSSHHSSEHSLRRVRCPPHRGERPVLLWRWLQLLLLLLLWRGWIKRVCGFRGFARCAGDAAPGFRRSHKRKHLQTAHVWRLFNRFGRNETKFTSRENKRTGSICAEKKKKKRERGENVNFAVRSFPPWMDDHLGVNSDPLWEVGQ